MLIKSLHNKPLNTQLKTKKGIEGLCSMGNPNHNLDNLTYEYLWVT